MQPLTVLLVQVVGGKGNNTGTEKAKKGITAMKIIEPKSVNHHPPVILDMARGKSQDSTTTTHILHDPCLSPVVGHKIARWDDDAEMARILEQLQLGVHRADAVHGREAELDVGGDVALHEGFLFFGGERFVS